ncbi:MAG TPA: DUF192 domain-containing protein [Actinomycetota bacterium]|nr:DUF192 domain-containing protein [Actinomycetota bacterium]
MIEAILEGGGRTLTVDVATTPAERLRGLLARPPPHPGTGLLLPGATSVHTVGLRFPIEVAWLDGELRVVAVRTLRPGRVALPRRGARHVLECPAGTGLREGERFSLRRPAAR